MRRNVSILLLIAFAGLATGVAERLHDRLPTHDESHCTIQLALHMPTTAVPVVVVLIGVGVFIAFLSQICESLVSVRIPLTLACRGPPAP
jgi:hypothetical protein